MTQKSKPANESPKLPTSTDATMTVSDKSSSQFGFIVVFLMSLAALGLAAYVWYDANQKHQSVINKLHISSTDSPQVLQAEFNTYKKEQAELLQKLTQGVEQVSQKQTNQQKILETANKGLMKVYQKFNTKPDDWILHEVEYMTRLAILNLQFTHNVPAAIELLKAAENRVQAVGDPTLFPVRRAIAETSMSLEAIASVDMISLLSKLDMLDRLASDLPLAKSKVGEDSVIAMAVSTEDVSDLPAWRKAWNKSVQSLSKVVTVRKHSDNLHPIVFPEHQLLVKENLHLLLQQAESALIQSNQSIYESSLEEAIRLIKNYADTEQGVAQKLISKIAELQKIELRPDTPDITPLLKTIQDTIMVRQQKSKQAVVS